VSGDPSTAVSEADAGTDSEAPASPSRALATVPRSLTPGTVRLAAGCAARLAVATATLLRVVRNLPFDPVAVPAGVRAVVVTGTPLVLGLALVAVALASDRPSVTVGLLFAGVFGLLATVDTAATLPAVVAIVAAGGLVMRAVLAGPTTRDAVRRVVLGGLLVAGTAVALGDAVGAVAGGRRLGSVLVLSALAVLGLRASGDRVALGTGALAFVAVVAASTANPYVAGSALLVGFAVVGAPHLLVGAAVAGCTAVLVAGLRRRAFGLAAGAGLLLLAGTPATVPRATAVLLGLTLALVDHEPPGWASESPSHDGAEVTR
jgi:hypothetical protein